MENKMIEKTIGEWFEINPDNTAWKMTYQEIVNVLNNPKKGNLGPEIDMGPHHIKFVLSKFGLAAPVVLRKGNIVLRGYRGIREKA
jgi:hypothetical protein